MELIVVGFQGRYRAAQVLTELRQRGLHLFDLDQAITVAWEDRRNFVVQQSINLSREQGSHWPRLWAAFIKATLYQPFTERLSNAATTVMNGSRKRRNGSSSVLEDDWWIAQVGIPDNFVRDVGALVRPGESAIITSADTFEPKTAVSVLRDFGGAVIFTSLTTEQIQKVQQELATTVD